MKIVLRTIIYFLLLAPSFLTIPAAQAGGLIPCSGPDCKPCHLFSLVVNITSFLFLNIALPLAGLVFLVGGIIMLAAGGSQGRYDFGKKMLINALFGLVIVLAAFAIVNTIISFFASTEFANGWWTVNCD